MNQAESTPDFRDIEERLANDVPFGLARYVQGRLVLHYRCRLVALARELADARRFAEALDRLSPEEQERLLCDPVVRCVVDELLSGLHEPAPELNGGQLPRSELDEKANLDERAFIAHYSAHLDQLRLETTLPSRILRQGVVPQPLQVWQSERLTTQRERTLASVVCHRLHRVRCYRATPAQTSTLEAALALLGALLPKLSRSALSHLSFVMLDEFEDDVGSATVAGVFGTVFLSHTTLRSPWTTAEALLHECMHLKFVDLEHTHSLLPSDYSEALSPRIQPFWHRPSVAWPLNRTLTAAHVYLGLVLYAGVARRTPELEKSHGPYQSTALTDVANAPLRRCEFLLEALEPYRPLLGPAGRAFLDWMHGVLESLQNVEAHGSAPRLCGQGAQ